MCGSVSIDGSFLTSYYRCLFNSIRVTKFTVPSVVTGSTDRTTPVPTSTKTQTKRKGKGRPWSPQKKFSEHSDISKVPSLSV